MSYQSSLEYTSKKWNPQLSKIVATIGPTSEQLPVLKDIVRSGMVSVLNYACLSCLRTDTHNRNDSAHYEIEL